MKVSIKKISEATGFSPATVSNALNYKKGVNKETAAIIFRTAREMGYIEENRITKIKFVIFKKNGSIVEDTPFFPLMIDGVERECRNCGYELVVCNIDQREEDYENQVKWLLSDTNSAIILLGTELMTEDLELFHSAKCPLLLFDCWCEDMTFHAVLINNADSSRMAVEYLIRKGHREIGYLKGSFRIKAFRSRFVGFQSGLSKAQIPLKKEYVLTLGTTMEQSYRDMKEYLSHKPKLPTAFCADNDLIAIGAMKALLECGYRVPEEVSLVGFDDLPFCEMMTPRLTTIRVSKQEMGQLAVRRLMELIKNKEESPIKMQVCTKFVERDSVQEITRRED